MFSIRKSLLERRIDGEQSAAFEQVFDLGTRDHRNLFGASTSPIVVPSDLAYPEALSMSVMGVKALYTQFQVKSSDLEVLMGALTSGYELARSNIYQSVGGRTHMSIAVATQVAGAIVAIVSNDVEVFRRAAAAALCPPAPWDVFPDAAPETLGTLQGDMELWWRQFWNPFWNSLPPAAREAYLARHVSPEWADCVRLHASV